MKLIVLDRLVDLLTTPQLERVLQVTVVIYIVLVGSCAYVFINCG